MKTYKLFLKKRINNQFKYDKRYKDCLKYIEL